MTPEISKPVSQEQFAPIDFLALSSLIGPKSVAIIGASADSSRIGGRPIAAMLRAGYQGSILPVNPNRDRLQGLDCYASVADLPEIPDAAIVAVPVKAAIEAVEALGQHGCKIATLFTAGFSEAGAEGANAQQRLIDTARRYNLRLLGPNSLGVWNVDLGYYGTFSSSLDTGFPHSGNIGIASQSGAFGAHLAAVARNRRIGTPVLISTGNEADITVADAIGWMAQSDQIDVICAYQEGFNDPQRLLTALAAARAAKKPVFMFKSGRSALGAKAASSHTASLTGDDAIADEILRAFGAIRVQDTEQMMDFAYAAKQKIYPMRNSLGFITVSGGAGIVASDEAERVGLPMPPMPKEAQARLSELLPICSPANPLDCTAQALNDLSLLHAFTSAALTDGGYGSVICFATYVAGGAEIAPRLLASLKPLREKFPDRLLVLCAMGPAEVIRQYEDAGFLVFEDPCRAVRALAAMGRVADALVKSHPAPFSLNEYTLPDTTPDEYQSKAVLAAAGIPIPNERLTQSHEEAVQAAEEIGFPVVMKIASPDILHKSEIGGVRLNISDAAELASAFSDITQVAESHSPDAKITGILVAEQITGGVECFMGVKRDPGFGPFAVFGLGGIFVEILNDIALRQCPFDAATAREMILSIRGAPLLTGARGRDPVDLEALAEILSRLSIFAAGAGDRLQSVDLNPVLALPDRAVALDAVIEVVNEMSDGEGAA